MTTRKMWVRRNYFETDAGFGTYVNPLSTPDPIPVLVTDATDMPDFEPGDRVRWKNVPEGRVFEVDGIYVDRDGKWSVVIVRKPEGYHTVEVAAMLTKIPREKTVTLRVTGPEDAVEDYMADAGSCTITGRHGVRVERVEEDR